MKILTLTLLLFLTSPVNAARPSDLHVFVGAGNNFVFPGAVRVGWDDWEGGLISRDTYGIGKRFFIGSKTYTQFGFAAVPAVTEFGVGLFGSLGFDLGIIWGIGFRGEVLALVEHHGQLICDGVLGLSWDL
ncbi:MAG: hypothetical protein IT289_07655 [Oligoflexia bacterium]|nr:hypothetical protein [Oligoflexia bacterium]